MTVSEVICPGDKIDIRLLQEVEQMEKKGETIKTYKSQVLDVMENGNIEISMPIEANKLVLLPLGVRLELVFYSIGNLFKGVGQIKERYKRENVYMLEIELKSQLEKFQRREYYRHSCIMDVNYYLLSEEESKLGNANAIFVQLQQEEQEEIDAQEEQENREQVGQMIDLSGGGIKFNASEELKIGQKLLLSIYLNSEKIDKQYYILGNVISCVPKEQAREKGKKYETRVKFLIDDDKVREEIIRYIFEEERRTRQREKR